MRFNIAQFLPEMARTAPNRDAIICAHAPDGFGRTKLTFSELNSECDALAWGLSEAGIGPGSRVLLGVRPGLEFVALTFAVFKIGAVPVLIDPGMGRTNLLHCVARAKPEAMIAIPAAHALRALTGHAAFDTVRVAVTVGRRWFWGGPTLAKIRASGLKRGPYKIADTTTESPAAILFTSGGTGPPKGVCYEHGMFGAQVEAIRSHFNIEPGEIDLPAFPLFALFSTALGTTCVIPDMNPSRPATCDPDKLIDAIQSRAVTYSFGSPAIWKRVGPRCIERGVTLPNLKRIMMAGAPVRGDVLAPFATILSKDADVFIPYGATEALPVSSMRGSEVLNETWALTRQGRGHCVGKPLPSMTVRVVNYDAAKSITPLTPNTIGEIIVSGPVVTKEYFEMPEATAAAKIIDDTGRLWHRMGDMGYLDETGRIWFCGRLAHRVTAANGSVFYSVCCEAIVEEFLRAKMGIEARAALIKTSSSNPALALEWHVKRRAAGVEQEIVKHWKLEPLGQHVDRVEFYRKPFPVDVRHNAKIDRELIGKNVSKSYVRN
ncbi:MAG: fatty acid CoA ligase family protein [Planctomycetota bacterium]